VGHCDEEFLEGLGLGLILGWGSGRRRGVTPCAAGSGCSNACSCLAVTVLLLALGSLALHLWDVTLPVALAAVAWRVIRRRQRRAAAVHAAVSSDMGALLRLLLIALVLGLAVEYWYVSVPSLAAAIAWADILRRDRRRRAALTAATVAAAPPAPNRVAGPVWWQDGTLELTPDQLVVTVAGTTGGIGRPVPFRRTTALPRARLIRVEKTTHDDDGESLSVLSKGGQLHRYQRCRDGEAIVRLLEVLAESVPVVENGVRWPRTPRPPRRATVPAPAGVMPVAMRCAVCGAPLERGMARCAYCGTGLSASG
jgi:hypothetical protein